MPNSDVLGGLTAFPLIAYNLFDKNILWPHFVLVYMLKSMREGEFDTKEVLFMDIKVASDIYTDFCVDSVLDSIKKGSSRIKTLYELIEKILEKNEEDEKKK
jgi:hypothetical protein